MVVTLPPAKANISPLIRFARWSALLTGVVYGAYRYSYLSKREIDIQKHDNEIKARYNARKAIEKQQKEAEEMTALGKEAGVVAK